MLFVPNIKKNKYYIYTTRFDDNNFEPKWNYLSTVQCILT